MRTRFSRLTTGAFVVAACVLLPSVCWAVFYQLGPSKDEWGLKYDVTVSDTSTDKATIEFTLADQGRLKPIYSATVVAFSPPGRDGGRSYLVKERIQFKTSQDGKPVGQVQVDKEFVDRAQIRILTLHVNGKRHRSASYYDIPLQKFLNQGLTAPLPVASPPAATISK